MLAAILISALTISSPNIGKTFSLPNSYPTSLSKSQLQFWGLDAGHKAVSNKLELADAANIYSSLDGFVERWMARAHNNASGYTLKDAYCDACAPYADGDDRAVTNLSLAVSPSSYATVMNTIHLEVVGGESRSPNGEFCLPGERDLPEIDWTEISATNDMESMMAGVFASAKDMSIANEKTGLSFGNLKMVFDDANANAGTNCFAISQHGSTTTTLGFEYSDVNDYLNDPSMWKDAYYDATSSFALDSRQFKHRARYELPLLDGLLCKFDGGVSFSNELRAAMSYGWKSVVAEDEDFLVAGTNEWSEATFIAIPNSFSADDDDITNSYEAAIGHEPFAVAAISNLSQSAGASLSGLLDMHIKEDGVPGYYQRPSGPEINGYMMTRPILHHGTLCFRERYWVEHAGGEIISAHDDPVGSWWLDGFPIKVSGAVYIYSYIVRGTKYHRTYGIHPYVNSSPFPGPQLWDNENGKLEYIDFVSRRRFSEQDYPTCEYKTGISQANNYTTTNALLSIGGACRTKAEADFEESIGVPVSSLVEVTANDVNYIHQQSMTNFPGTARNIGYYGGIDKIIFNWSQGDGLDGSGIIVYADGGVSPFTSTKDLYSGKASVLAAIEPEQPEIPDDVRFHSVARPAALWTFFRPAEGWGNFNATNGE